MTVAFLCMCLFFVVLLLEYIIFSLNGETLLCKRTIDMDSVQYTRTKLIGFRPEFNLLLLPNKTRVWIKALGIKRRFRGHRGQIARKKRSKLWKEKWERNNRVHLKLLRKLPSMTVYDNNNECKLGLVNARSLRNKINQFIHYSITEDLDICFITETWLKDTDTVEIASVRPPGYDFINFERKKRVGGGIGTFYKSEIQATPIKSGELVSFEYAQIQFKINFFKIDIVVIYRPPYSEQHPISVNVFMEEFGDFVSDVFLNCNRCCFVGDFNLHVNNPFDVDSQSFNDLLNSFCLNQIVTVPTHTSGNTLDLVLVQENSDFEIFNEQSEFHLSDHSFVLFNISTKRPRLVRKETKFRKLKAIDDSLFQHDLKHLFSELQEICELEEIVSAYDKGLTDILISMCLSYLRR